MTLLDDPRLMALAGPLLDDPDTDWDGARELTYALHQCVRYTYSAPARDIRQRLMLVPPARHGDQRRIAYGVTADAVNARRRERVDAFGNVVTDFRMQAPTTSVVFEAWALVTRRPAQCPQSVTTARHFMRPSRLTEPDAYLTDVSASLGGGRNPDLALAEAICDWVWRALRYEHDATSVQTTAANAAALGRGVCQDFAHVMVTLCRLAGMPARYVSGHLLGEGGSHAWVEVLLPDTQRSRVRVAHAFDPTHGTRTGSRHLTVAVGRDYEDVAPLSGTCIAPVAGTMRVTKRAGVAGIEYVV
jgi:transglutaminase-like putative cysteine protease